METHLFLELDFSVYKKGHLQRKNQVQHTEFAHADVH